MSGLTWKQHGQKSRSLEQERYDDARVAEALVEHDEWDVDSGVYWCSCSMCQDDDYLKVEVLERLQNQGIGVHAEGCERCSDCGKLWRNCRCGDYC